MKLLHLINRRQGGTRWASGKPGGGLTTSSQKPKKSSPKERVTKVVKENYLRYKIIIILKVLSRPVLQLQVSL